jgi:hypothetical protein
MGVYLGARDQKFNDPIKGTGPHCRLLYSVRNASMGSRRAARRAGTIPAAKATAAKNEGTTTKVSGSCDPMPNKRLFSRLEAATAAGIEMVRVADF